LVLTNRWLLDMIPLTNSGSHYWDHILDLSSPNCLLVHRCLSYASRCLHNGKRTLGDQWSLEKLKCYAGRRCRRMTITFGLTVYWNLVSLHHAWLYMTDSWISLMLESDCFLFPAFDFTLCLLVHGVKSPLVSARTMQWLT
jgi:hypothetical protein